MAQPSLAVLLCALAVAACAGNQKLLGRYESATCYDDSTLDRTDCHTIIPRIEVAVTLAPKAPDKAADVTVGTLPERAAARYVDAMQRFNKNADTFRRSLAEPITAPVALPAFTDASTFPGTLYLTAAYADPINPADRIDRLRITVTLQGGTVLSWTGARTIFTDIKPGSIMSTGKASLSGSLDVKPPSSPVGGSLTASTDRTRQETLDVVQHIEDITPIVQPPDKIIIVRRGGFGLDLTGNAQVDVVLGANDDRVSIATLFQISGYGSSNETKPSQLQVTGVYTRFSKLPLTAIVEADYVVRHIVLGDGTSEEGDDRVEYITKHTRPSSFTLAYPSGNTWGLASKVSRVGNTHRFLAIQPLDAPAIKLCFKTQSQADALREYLVRQSGSPRAIAGQMIGLQNGVALSPYEKQDLEASLGCVQG